MSDPNQPICRYLAGVAFHARGTALALLRRPLLVPLALLVLGTLLLATDAIPPGPTQASVNAPATTAVDVKAIHAGGGCATPNPEATIT